VTDGARLLASSIAFAGWIVVTAAVVIGLFWNMPPSLGSIAFWGLTAVVVALSLMSFGIFLRWMFDGE
jgi:hypothetical protein